MWSWWFYSALGNKPIVVTGCTVASDIYQGGSVAGETYQGGMQKAEVYQGGTIASQAGCD